MKKSIILALALVFVMAGTAFAGPFADVPANHWSYDAVNKLAQAGIIDGYGDGTFRGDRTMTRYEMAQIVGKAMERSDKADAETKALINKLADEYAQELDNLGVRVANLEKKVGNITWTGQVREWYQWQDDLAGDHTGLDTRLLLWMEAPLSKDLTFKGRLSAWSGWGEFDHRVGSTVEMDNAYLAGKNFTLGRQGITLGQGLVYNALYNNDGITYTVGGDKLKVTAAAFKNILDTNIIAANVAYKASDDLDITAVYAKNRSSDKGKADLWGDVDLDIPAGEIIKTWSLGFNYRGIDNITLVGEYGENSSEVTNAAIGDDAKAWVARATYKGAQWTQPHTWGLWVGYRDADDGFNSLTGDPLWETHLGVLGSMIDVKGAEYGFDYTLFNNGVFTFNYLDLEDQAGNDAQGATAQLRYFF